MSSQPPRHTTPRIESRVQVNLLDKSVATGATSVVFLQLHIFELAEGLKDGLQVLLGDVEVNIADVEAVEGRRTGLAPSRFRIAGESVLLSFGELDDDRNTCQWLSGKLKGLLNRFFVSELDVANSATVC